MNLVLVGAPLSGKGTQAELITEKYGLVNISTGDLFREIMTKQTPLGEKVKSYMDRAMLVPDEITIEVLKEKLSNINSSNGVLLDGFPRTLNQAKKLDEIIQIDKVIYLKAELEQLLLRVKDRFICEKCKKTNTVSANRQLSCKFCGANLVKRKDDTLELAASRFNEFMLKTLPIVDYYKKKQKLFVVESNDTIENIFTKIDECLKSVE